MDLGEITFGEITFGRDRVVFGRNQVTLGEKSLVLVYVKGKRGAKSPSGGQLIFVEINTIAFGRIYLGSSCLRHK